MHSVFWTLAKTDYGAAVQGTDSRSAWAEDQASDIVPSRLHDDMQDLSYNAFIQESTLDEIAYAGGTDPLDLRRRLMSPYPAATRLIDAVARMSNWQEPVTRGKARGFAFAFSNGSWVAEVIEVSEAETGIRIDAVHCAVDAGPLADESIRRAVIEADIRRALREATGREIRQRAEAPTIHVKLLKNAVRPGLGGAPAAQPIMPALANAVFALTGKRIRRTPLGDEIAFL
jgi:isoquinoline 1-oxidoreductase beta subunit